MIIKARRNITIILIFLLALFPIMISISASPPMPGLPYSVSGTVKYSDGENLPDGSIVKAIVDNENYTTEVVDGTYGVFSPFYVEDSENDNHGKNIFFFVNDINTSQSILFESGSTDLNLTIDNQNNNNNDNNNNNGNSGSPPGDPVILNPVAIIQANTYGFVNKSIVFNASNSNSPNDEIVSYDWSFGDGTFASGIKTNHIYSSVGNYTVTLKVTDSSGLYDNDEISIKIMIDSDNDSWGDSEEGEYGTDYENQSDYPADFDGDHIPDFIDEDDDNDGLNDIVEGEIGSYSKNPSDVINISVLSDGGFLVDVGNDNIFEFYYNIITSTKTSLKKENNDEYLIDIDDDGEYEYIYNVTTGISKGYETSPGVTIIVLTIILIILVLILFIIFYKKKKK